MYQSSQIELVNLAENKIFLALLFLMENFPYQFIDYSNLKFQKTIHTDFQYVRLQINAIGIVQMKYYPK